MLDKRGAPSVIGLIELSPLRGVSLKGVDVGSLRKEGQEYDLQVEED